MTRSRVAALVLAVTGFALVGLLAYMFPRLLDSRDVYALALSTGKLGAGAPSVNEWFRAFCVNYIVFVALGVLLLVCSVALWRRSRLASLLCIATFGFYLLSYALLALFSPAFPVQSYDLVELAIISSVLLYSAYLSRAATVA
jgi:hypothetical protein